MYKFFERLLWVVHFWIWELRPSDENVKNRSSPPVEHCWKCWEVGRTDGAYNILSMYSLTLGTVVLGPNCRPQSLAKSINQPSIVKASSCSGYTNRYRYLPNTYPLPIILSSKYEPIKMAEFIGPKPNMVFSSLIPYTSSTSCFLLLFVYLFVLFVCLLCPVFWVNKIDYCGKRKFFLNPVTIHFTLTERKCEF